MNWDLFFPVALGVVGLISSVIFLSKQLHQQRRLSYVTCLLGHKEICEEYQAFLFDLRFLWNALKVFDKLQVTAESVKTANADRDKRETLNLLVQYMKAAFYGGERSGNQYLLNKFGNLAITVKKHESSEAVFQGKFLINIQEMFHEIDTALTFRPGEAWFLTLFAHSEDTRTIICEYLLKNDLHTQANIDEIEKQLRLFLKASERTWWIRVMQCYDQLLHCA